MEGLRVLIIFIGLIHLIAGASLAPEQKVRYDNYKVYETTVKNREQYALLQSLDGEFAVIIKRMNIIDSVIIQQNFI